MTISISAVICTYNRSQLLVNAINSLSTQSLDKSRYEIIVVDNCSTDNTSEVVHELERTSNLKYVYESQQGLSFARNKGLEVAKGSYVAYFDDDCIVNDKWLEVAIEIIEQVKPKVFGGSTFPFYDTSKPYWFKDSYRTRNLGDQSRFLYSEYLSGTNICFDISVLKEFGGFDPKLGMSGKKIAFSEETAIQKVIRNNYLKNAVYYDPRLYVKDLVRSEKMDLKWIFKERFASGFYSYFIFSDNLETESNFLIIANIESSLKIVLQSFIFVLSVLWGSFFRNRDLYPFMQNYIHECSLKHIKRVGWHFGSLLN